MKLKLISLTALTALSLGGVALAQGTTDSPRGNRGMRHDPMARAIEQLNLTPDQKTKVQPILDAAKPQMEQIHRDAMEKSKALMNDTMAKIKPMLTTEQQSQLDQIQANPRGDRGGRRGHRGGGGGDATTGDDGNG